MMSATSTDIAKVYISAPLGLHCENIRLVSIRPTSEGNISDRISCELRSHKFGSICPQYIAVSYEWGPQQPCHYIKLNRAQLPVGRNLWMLLWHMRLRGQQGPL
jgi:hypothetical protein